MQYRIRNIRGRTTVSPPLVHVEHINRSALGITSDVTIILNCAVEYSLSYDLGPESLTVAGDASGITVTLERPELVSSTAIGAISHEIPGKGLLIDEQEQVIALQRPVGFHPPSPPFHSGRAYFSTKGVAHVINDHRSGSD